MQRVDWVIALAIAGALVGFVWAWLWREMDSRSRPVRARVIVILASLVPPSPCWGVVAFMVDLRKQPLHGEWSWRAKLWPWARAT
jgi:hypothetical protein